MDVIVGVGLWVGVGGADVVVGGTEVAESVDSEVNVATWVGQKVGVGATSDGAWVGMANTKIAANRATTPAILASNCSVSLSIKPLLTAKNRAIAITIRQMAAVIPIAFLSLV